MILTVTLNPSLDRTIEIDHLERGGVIRARATQLHPGGKGVNVTRALLGNAVPSLAVLPAGGHEGRRLLTLLDAEGVAHRTVVVAGETRSNTTVAEADGTTTKLNEPGAPLLPEELSAIAELVVAAAVPGRWAVLCGSLPPGVPTDQYARTTERLQAAGMRVAVDTSGAPLAAALEAGPDLVKPNAAELGETVGRRLTTLREVVAAALEIKAGTVLVSLGADGAVLVDDAGALVGRSRADRPRSSVGAGDAFLAGYLSAVGDGRERALTTALAWGAAAVQLPGSQMPGPADIDLTAARLLTPAELETHLDAPLRAD